MVAIFRRRPIDRTRAREIPYRTGVGGCARGLPCSGGLAGAAVVFIYTASTFIRCVPGDRAGRVSRGRCRGEGTHTHAHAILHTVFYRLTAKKENEDEDLRAWDELGCVAG